MASVQIQFNHNNENQDGGSSNNQLVANVADGLAAESSSSNNNILKCDNKIDCNNNNSNQMAIVSPMKRLKKMGWYWGSISPDYASKLLENEEDGSFLVRDSSSECYIFAMTYKLEGLIRHSRIEHCKGQFSFARTNQQNQPSPKFICTTIVDFIEQAIEYSHNGHFLFFLHRDPAEEGPVRFRLMPLSRLKCMSSLKHMCRFAILPYVRRDKISELSIPECLREYLFEPFQQSGGE